MRNNGFSADKIIMDCYQNRAINESIRYAEYKDVNDYRIGRKSIIPHKEDVYNDNLLRRKSILSVENYIFRDFCVDFRTNILHC